MGRIKRMSLKSSLFTLTFLNFVIAAILAVIAFGICVKSRSAIAPQGVLLEPGTGQISNLPLPARENLFAANILEALQYVLPIFIFMASSFVTSAMFYRLKLKNSVAILTKGANRIIENDLDFTIEAESEDELGQLCSAFETMRQTLLTNNRKLWKQAEEQKRLNAAFSHELKNPITVLKGSVKLARIGIQSRRAGQEQMLENLERIEDYTSRIEKYVETMSSVQQLEQIPLCLKNTGFQAFVSELTAAVHIIGLDSKREIHVQAEDTEKVILIDRSILLQIAENMVSNALRFAKREVWITCTTEGEHLEICVNDDGCGFPDSLLANGIRPFQKGREEAGHFGMGLYIGDLLCRKHGGYIEIQNRPVGAAVKAIVKII